MITGLVIETTHGPASIYSPGEGGWRVREDDHPLRRYPDGTTRTFDTIESVFAALGADDRANDADDGLGNRVYSATVRVVTFGSEAA